jgi:hypothetical protein
MAHVIPSALPQGDDFSTHITGVRYTRPEEDYDLCENCFRGLDATERRSFIAVLKPLTAAVVEEIACAQLHTPLEGVSDCCLSFGAVAQPLAVRTAKWL